MAPPRDGDERIPTVMRDARPPREAAAKRRGRDAHGDVPAPVAAALQRVRASPVPVAAVKLALPLAIAALHLATLPLVFPGRWLPMFGAIWAYFLPPAGKESVIPAAIAAGYDPWIVALYIAGVDAIVGLFLVWNWDLTLRIPVVGATIRKGIQAGERVIQERPWIQRLSTAGVVLFVMVPFQGSGAMGGSIVGRMIGLPPYRVWLAIIIGSLLGTLAIAGLAGSVRYAFQQAMGTGIAVLVAALLVVVAAAYLWIGNRQDVAAEPAVESE